MISKQAAIDAILSCSVYATVDELKKQCEKSAWDDNGWAGGVKDAIEAIEDMTDTADVLPVKCTVKRFLWDETDSGWTYGNEPVYSCPVCGKNFARSNKWQEILYCWNCGQKVSWDG